MFTPTPKQNDLIEALRAFPYVISVWGRRSGKTSIAAFIASALLRYGDSTLYISPSMKQGDQFFTYCCANCRGFAKPLNHLKIIRTNNAEINVRSGGKPDLLRGAKTSGMVIVDEFALFQDTRIFDEVILPMAADKPFVLDRVRMLFLSSRQALSPTSLYLDEMASKNKSLWTRIEATTFDNTHLNKAHILDLRTMMSDAAYRREILNEDAQGAATRFLLQRIKFAAAPCSPDCHRFWGIDWGISHDRTVIAGICRTHKAIDYEIISREGGSSAIADRVAAYLRPRLSRACVVFSESNGIGKPLTSLISERRIPVTEISINSDRKVRAITNFLDIIYEYSIRDSREVREELTAFDLSENKLKAEHGHDDIIMACAIAAYNMAQSGRPIQQQRGGGYGSQNRLQAYV